MLENCRAFSRREFGLSLCSFPLSLRLAAEELGSGPWNAPATVAKVYLGAPKVYWPTPLLDIRKEVAEIELRLAEVQKKHVANVRLVGGEILNTPEEVQPWLAKTGDVDGVLMIPIAQPTPPLRAMVDSLTVPALFFSRPYATHAWSTIAAMRREGKKLDVVASSSYGDLDPYMMAFRTAHHLRTTKVLVAIEASGGRREIADGFHKFYGTTFQFIGGAQLRAAFDAVPEKRAQEAADEFVRGALRVVEPTPKEIRDGLRFYLGIVEMMKREKANAVTVDCFGTLKANTLPGYPCIAWSKLNDQGLYGVCEGDLPSTMTQILITSYTGMPGFVSDPVFDTSRNEVIHAHCVAATRMKGIHGPASPYILRNHLETNEGATIQVLMPANEAITVARFSGPARLLVSAAEVTDPVDSPRGCRSQIRTRVKDAEKWLQSYGPGLHRVIFYGDHMRSIERMGRLMGFEPVQEM